jgi:protein arginine kinase activator
MENKLCGECNANPANIHLAQIVQNEMTVMHLCEACARKKGISIVIESAGNESIFDSPVGQKPLIKQEEADVVCPSCRMSLKEFREKGWLGCASCYTAFESEINSILFQMHGPVTYKGKNYGKADPGTPDEVLSSLKKELQDAILNDRFEVAAILRDKINQVSIKG